MRPSRILTASVVALLAGCSMSSPSSQDARISVLLKDAPANVTHAVVTISEIDLVGDGGSQVLSTTEHTTDLLTLANDVTTLVDAAPIPAGTYSQLRFVITGAYIEVDGAIYASSPDYAGLPAGTPPGSVGVLRMPSYGQSGLKVVFDGGVTIADGTTTLVVDFDVSQSFGHAAGSSGAWVMHPVVRGARLEETGQVEATLSAGAVVLPGGTTLGDFWAELIPSGETTGVLVQFTSQGETYAADFSFVLPGDYTLVVVPPTGFTCTTDPVSAPVTVVGGGTASAAFTLTAFAPAT
jgi:hypothetical protein